MKLSKRINNPLITGTLWLTAAGVLSRLIGFFYKIFLSRAIGAEGLGLYHLVFPLLALCFALSFEGIQTAVSRFVGGAKSEAEARAYLFAGLLLSCALSLFSGIVLYKNADPLARYILGDARCGQLLKILTVSFLPACVHACINGYYFGKKKALVPSVSQLAEQIARVLGVYLLYSIVTEQGGSLTAVHACWGIVLGELLGLLISTTCYGMRHFHAPAKKLPLFRRQPLSCKNNPYSSRGKISTGQKCRGTVMGSLFAMSFPLTLNHTLVHLFSGLENLLIPQRLVRFGYSQSDALSLFGVLTGMAISIIFFPSVLTNSLSVLLLPTVSEDHARGNSGRIAKTVNRALYFGLGLGLCCTLVFLTTGNFIGNVIFHNALAGVLICRLAWLCPLMYIYGLLGSILHGLGRPNTVLAINLLASLIRIGAILFLVPRYGLNAVLWGMLLGQLFATLAAVYEVRRVSKLSS